tara:strand:- start:669 stop:1841 length:1173 start_codon:yes stop_codon:yes gene_type:complete
MKKMLRLSNTKHIEISVPTPPSNRNNVDYQELQKIKWQDYSIDSVFLNLPHHATQLKNYFTEFTNINPTFFGFTHFRDYLDIMQRQSLFRMHAIGILDMDVCYFNSNSKKDHFIEQASRVFNVNVIRKLNQIITVFPREILPSKIEEVSIFDHDPLRIIVFNHKPELEKSFPLFCAAIEELWIKRKDFRVWVPFYTKRRAPFEWMITDIPKATKKEYYYGLGRCCLGVSPKQIGGNWTTSTADGLLSGLPYIVYDDQNYKQLNPRADIYKNRRQLNKLISFYLDNVEYRNKKVEEGLSYIHENFMLEEISQNISAQINSQYNSQKKIISAISRQIVSLIKEEKSITHRVLLKKMHWDSSVKFNGYRRYILDDKQIDEEPGNWKSIYTNIE